jgi:hypothetical protein
MHAVHFIQLRLVTPLVLIILCEQCSMRACKPGSEMVCRVYSQSHMDFLLEVAAIVASQRARLRGFRILQQTPFLRHFSAVLAPVE